jgi:hypothetical protein
MTRNAYLNALRAAMSRFPALDAHPTGTRIDPNEIYFPTTHAAALDPERSLVIGNRGMGKSFWASALVQPDARERIASTWPETRLAGAAVKIEFSFSGAEGAVGISRDELSNLVQTGAPAEAIWRSITIPKLAALCGAVVPARSLERLKWVVEKPEVVRDILRAADAALTGKNSRILFVFDQLEQLSDELTQRRDLIQGILRLALAYKSYRNLRLKVFMRLDQRADSRIFQFPDSSKISGEAVYLDWRPTDLYGLLYGRLCRSEHEAFYALAAEVGVTEQDLDQRSQLPKALIEDGRIQHRLFDRIAGEFMGSERRRGLTYSWLVLHLADSRNQVSPRTFLRALRYAAEYSPSPSDTVIDYRGIHEGVREAARNRVDDLKEDYPWVPPALERLRGLSVPTEPSEMLNYWRNPSVIEQLIRNTPNDKQPAWLANPDDLVDVQLEQLLEAMSTVGVIERRVSTGKVDVPDIFRLPYDIRRRGGVTPQQRRKARLT